MTLVRYGHGWSFSEKVGGAEHKVGGANLKVGGAAAPAPHQLYRKLQPVGMGVTCCLK